MLNVTLNSVTLTNWKCKSLLPSGFSSQQDGASADTAKLAQDWIFATNCSEFIGKDEWPPNSSDINPLDYHAWGVMLEHYKTFNPKPKNTDGLKKVLQLIWDQLLQDSINKVILSFIKDRACVKYGMDTDWERALKKCLTLLNIEHNKRQFISSA